MSNIKFPYTSWLPIVFETVGIKFNWGGGGGGCVYSLISTALRTSCAFMV
jgi:hypothetical protein